MSYCTCLPTSVPQHLHSNTQHLLPNTCSPISAPQHLLSNTCSSTPASKHLLLNICSSIPKHLLFRSMFCSLRAASAPVTTRRWCCRCWKKFQGPSRGRGASQAHLGLLVSQDNVLLSQDKLYRVFRKNVPYFCIIYISVKIEIFHVCLFHIIGNFVFHPIFFPEYLLNYECTVRSWMNRGKLCLYQRIIEMTLLIFFSLFPVFQTSKPNSNNKTENEL